METVKFLELMAQKVHHHSELDSLINSQSKELINAYRANDNASIRKYIGESEFVANPSDVVQITN